MSDVTKESFEVCSVRQPLAKNSKESKALDQSPLSWDWMAFEDISYNTAAGLGLKAMKEYRNSAEMKQQNNNFDAASGVHTGIHYFLHHASKDAGAVEARLSALATKRAVDARNFKQLLTKAQQGFQQLKASSG